MKLRLHQVLMAILMFKTLDLAILYAATVPESEHFIGRLVAFTLVWIVAWIAIWVLVELFMEGRLPGQGDGHEG
jgi:hypothetical protein